MKLKKIFISLLISSFVPLVSFFSISCSNTKENKTLEKINQEMESFVLENSLMVKNYNEIPTILNVTTKPGTTTGSEVKVNVMNLLHSPITNDSMTSLKDFFVITNNSLTLENINERVTIKVEANINNQDTFEDYDGTLALATGKKVKVKLLAKKGYTFSNEEKEISNIVTLTSDITPSTKLKFKNNNTKTNKQLELNTKNNNNKQIPEILPFLIKDKEGFSEYFSLNLESAQQGNIFVEKNIDKISLNEKNMLVFEVSFSAFDPTTNQAFLRKKEYVLESPLVFEKKSNKKIGMSFKLKDKTYFFEDMDVSIWNLYIETYNYIYNSNLNDIKLSPTIDLSKFNDRMSYEEANNSGVMQNSFSKRINNNIYLYNLVSSYFLEEDPNLQKARMMVQPNEINTNIEIRRILEENLNELEENNSSEKRLSSIFDFEYDVILPIRFSYPNSDAINNHIASNSNLGKELLIGTTSKTYSPIFYRGDRFNLEDTTTSTLVNEQKNKKNVFLAPKLPFKQIKDRNISVEVGEVSVENDQFIRIEMILVVGKEHFASRENKYVKYFDLKSRSFKNSI